MRRILVLVATLIVSAALTSAAAPAAGALACSTTWGSLPKEALTMGTGEVDDVRTGRQECFDRVVVDIDGPPAGFRAAYVDTVTADGSGDPIAVPGGARISFIVGHPAYSPQFFPGTPLATVTGYDTLRSVVGGGSFEGQTQIGVGVRARLPFRVFVLQGGHGRIVLDVAHHW